MAAQTQNYGFIVVHIPHASLVFPEEYRRDFLVSEKILQKEIRLHTDAFCDELYDAPEFPVRILAQVNRVICDMERFREDAQEGQARRGRGLMYTRSWWGRKLRENDPVLREKLLREIYDPHHERLTAAVDVCLARYGKCLIIDGHSFNSRSINKFGNPVNLPDFDIGLDPFHTPRALGEAMGAMVKSLGYTLKYNNPYGGPIVPMKHYGRDKRVISVMIEANRRLYMDERGFVKNAHFQKTREACHALMRCAAEWASKGE
jgi:N-formylglutamate amidohydrolase